MRRYTVAMRNYDGYVEHIVLDGRDVLAMFSLRSDAVSLADRLEACRTDTPASDCGKAEA